MSSMVSLRRLRAVLLLSVVSAIGWGLLGTLLSLGFLIYADMSIGWSQLYPSFIVFSYMGFVAGAVWSLVVGSLRQRNPEGGLSAWGAALAGLLGGLLVAVTLFLMIAEPAARLFNDFLLPLGIFGLIGGGVGLAIQRTASRGQLESGESTVRAIES